LDAAGFGSFVEVFCFLNVGFAELVSCKLSLFGCGLLLKTAVCAVLLYAAVFWCCLMF
jgi:hypothetical protein